jgi:hypothetical protein
MDFNGVMRKGSKAVAFYFEIAVVAAVLMTLVLILLGVLQV